MAAIEYIFKDIKGVIFDLDGTLVDSMWMWSSIDEVYLGRFGIVVPDDLQICIEGKSFDETARYIKGRFQLEDSIKQIKADWNEMAWDKYAYEVPLKKGVPEFLQLCKERNIQMGIATSNSSQLANHIAQVHGLGDYISQIKTSCDTKVGKPAPDVYLMVADELGLKSENCLVFEDLIPGIQAGIAAGMKVCAIEDEYSRYQQEEKILMADYYIKDYWDIINSLPN